MNEMMTFPDTWEKFEKSYGFTDNEEVYTNGARIIPSFIVKQWLDHLSSKVSQKWIPCSKKLPEIKEGHESDVVLCYTDTGSYAFSRLQENIFGQCGFECEREDEYYTSVGEVIAWMPLPEPYKEVKE